MPDRCRCCADELWPEEKASGVCGICRTAIARINDRPLFDEHGDEIAFTTETFFARLDALGNDE